MGLMINIRQMSKTWGDKYGAGWGGNCVWDTRASSELGWRFLRGFRGPLEPHVWKVGKSQKHQLRVQHWCHLTVCQWAAWVPRRVFNGMGMASFSRGSEVHGFEGKVDLGEIMGELIAWKRHCHLRGKAWTDCGKYNMASAYGKCSFGDKLALKQ